MMRVLYFSSFMNCQKQNRKSWFEDIWILRFCFKILIAWKIAILKKRYFRRTNINHLLTLNMGQYHKSLHHLHFPYYKKSMSFWCLIKKIHTTYLVVQLYKIIQSTQPIKNFLLLDSLNHTVSNWKISFLFPSKRLVEVLFLSFFIPFLFVFTRVDILVNICTEVFVYRGIFCLSSIAVNSRCCRVKRDTQNLYLVFFWSFLRAYFWESWQPKPCLKHFVDISQELK